MSTDIIMSSIVATDDGPRIRIDTKPRGACLGPVCVRVKGARSGLIYEGVSELVRCDGDDGGFILSVPKSVGYKPGDTVFLRISKVDVTRWFESDTSTPLTGVGE